MSRRLCLAGTAAAGFLAAASVQAGEVPVGGTHVGGKLFLDVTRIDPHGSGANASDTQADLKRFYIGVDHRFSPVWSAHLTTDIQWHRHDDPTDLRVKHAYLEGRFSKAFTLRLGAASTPWASMANRWYGYRYVEKGLVMRAKVGISADWGVHALGALGDGRQVDYAVSLVTGAGYKKPRLGHGPDVVARVSWQPVEHLVLALGGYHGTLASDADDRRGRRTARRWDAMVAYADARWRVGVQYFRAEGWDPVMQPGADRSHGWSAWASMQVTPEVSVFARHDHVRPGTVFDPGRHDRYSNAGIEWRARRWLRLAAVYKRERLRMDGFSRKTVNEAGVWAQVTF